jgi:hypothetical protein
MPSEGKRRLNERKFSNWEELAKGGRRCWVEVTGRHGWRARYVKEVDKNDETLRFYQEIFNDRGALVEVHEKFPFNRGHKEVKG